MPMDVVSVDVTGPLHTTKDGNKYIVALLDHLTRWPEAFAMKDQTTTTIAKLLVNNVFTRFGLPRASAENPGSDRQRPGKIGGDTGSYRPTAPIVVALSWGRLAPSSALRNLARQQTAESLLSRRGSPW